MKENFYISLMITIFLLFASIKCRSYLIEFELGVNDKEGQSYPFDIGETSELNYKSLDLIDLRVFKKMDTNSSIQLFLVK